MSAPGPRRLLILLMALVGSLMACAVPKPSEAEPTTIEYFRASQQSVARGASVELSWSATGSAQILDASGCSLVRRVQAEEADAPTAVPCEGSSIEVMDLPAPALYAYFEFRAAAPPGQATDATISASLVVEVVDPPTPEPGEIVVSISPEAARLAVGQSQAFTAEVSGAEDASVTWSSTGGQVVGSGSSIVYLAPDEPGEYVLTATSVEDPARAASATITVADVGISIEPAAVSLLTGESRSFTASIEGTESVAVTWSATGGVVSGSGTTVSYQAPAVAGEYLLTATSVAVPGLSTSATISVVEIGVSLEPSSARLYPGQTQSFTATLSGAPDSGVAWSSSCGSLSGVGSTVTFHAPAAPIGCVLTATSQLDPSKGATADIEVVAAPSGDLLWTRTVASAEGEEGAAGIAVDAEGGAVVVGSTSGDLYALNESAWAAFIVRYDADGVSLWRRQIGGAFDVQGVDVAFDGNGDIVLVLNTRGDLLADPSGVGYGVYVAKLEADGDWIWQMQFGMPEGTVATAVTTDAEDHIIVIGMTPSQLDPHPVYGEGGVYAAKLTPQGDIVWLTQWDSLPPYGAVSDVVTDAQGNVYLAGGRYVSATFHKLGPDGTHLWTMNPFPYEVMTSASGIAIGADGGLVLVGGYASISMPGRAAVAKFDADGELLWRREFGSADGAYAYGVAIGPDDDVTFVGRSAGSVGGPDPVTPTFLARFTPAGSRVWARHIPPSLEGAEVAVDPSGNAWVWGTARWPEVGEPGPSGYEYDAWLAKFLP